MIKKRATSIPCSLYPDEITGSSTDSPESYAFCTPYHKEVTFTTMPSYSEVLEFPIDNNIVNLDEKINSRIKLGLDLSKTHIINVGLWTQGKNQKEGIELASSVK